MRFERQRFLTFSVLMAKGPVVARSPMREREQFVIEQIPRRSWSFDPFKVSGARNQLMSIGKDFPGNQRRISKRADAKRQIDPISDMLNKSIGDQNLYPDVGVRYLERAKQRCDQGV